MQFNLVQMKNESNSFINVFIRIFVYNSRNIKLKLIYVLEKYC